MNIKVATKPVASVKKIPSESKIEEQLKECDTETFHNSCVSEPIVESNPEEEHRNANGENERVNSVNQEDLLTSASLNKSKRTVASNSILSRAAFWDKRVKDGIIDDDVAIKQFPKVDGDSSSAGII